MRTHVPSPRVNRHNPHLRRLDREIRLHGESMQLIQTQGVTTQTLIRVDVRGIVRTLGVEQLIAGTGITQTSYVVVVSPNDLKARKWLSSTTGYVANSGFPLVDRAVPVASGVNQIFFRGTQKAISRVDPIYDGDLCVRIEIFVTG